MRIKPVVGFGIGVAGAIASFTGLCIYWWISNHSPDMGLAAMMLDPSNYIIKHPLYDIIVLVSIVLGVGGIGAAFLGFGVGAYLMTRQAR